MPKDGHPSCTEGSDCSSNVEDVEEDHCSLPQEGSLHANTVGRSKEALVSKLQITRITTAPTKYAVG